jgi:hypothetical protein
MEARSRRRTCVGLNASRNDESAFQFLCRDGRTPRAPSKLLPALFIIGSLKTGTTSLWSQLVDHSGGAVLPGALTDKGDVSRKEKDFFGDPSMWRRGPRWYDKIWPTCPGGGAPRVAVDATPAYHVWHDAPQNMLTYFGPQLVPRLKLVWMMRDPISKFWSYFWELKSYGGEWSTVQVRACIVSSHACVGSGSWWDDWCISFAHHRMCMPGAHSLAISQRRSLHVHGSASKWMRPRLCGRHRCHRRIVTVHHTWTMAFTSPSCDDGSPSSNHHSYYSSHSVDTPVVQPLSFVTCSPMLASPPTS